MEGRRRAAGRREAGTPAGSRREGRGRAWLRGSPVRLRSERLLWWTTEASATACDRGTTSRDRGVDADDSELRREDRPGLQPSPLRFRQPGALPQAGIGRAFGPQLARGVLL